MTAGHAEVCLQRNAGTGAVTEVDVSDDIPEEIIWRLKAYLAELPGYDLAVPLDKQKGEEPAKQHGFAQMYFTATFQQLAVSLGHIFKVEAGDIDMRDIVLNRRILVVNLPAPENSGTTLAALGNLVVASLRGMMVQLLGASLEGDYIEANKPGMGPSPFPVVPDELAYYATSGLDRMLAMGRRLNISFMLDFQEVSGIWARSATSRWRRRTRPARCSRAARCLEGGNPHDAGCRCHRFLMGGSGPGASRPMLAA